MVISMRTERWPKKIDRYVICDQFASGGTASVHFGRLVGPAGFGRIVAIKRLLDAFVEDPMFVRMLVDEAKLAARINHQNVVQTLDVLIAQKDTYVVMEYVRGVPLSLLRKRSKSRGQRIDPAIAATIVSNVLHGLHAAHEATNEHGEPLNIVHRDVSPQNVLIGVDGAARVLDFGIAKAAGMTQVTREGYVKGKLAYMAPEHLLGQAIDRRADIFAAGIVLWELLTGERPFSGASDAQTIAKLTSGERVAPSAIVPEVAPFDALVLSCLDCDVAKRPPTARAMATALQDCWPMVPASEVGEWVNALAGDVLEVHRQHLSEIETCDLAELIALPDELAVVPPPAKETDSEYEQVETSELQYGPRTGSEAEQTSSSTEAAEHPDASEDETDGDYAEQEAEADAEAESEEPANGYEEETDEESDASEEEPESYGPRWGRLLAGGLIIGMGMAGFVMRQQLSDYLFPSDDNLEAKVVSPSPTSSAASEPVVSAVPPAAPPPEAIPTASAPAPSEPAKIATAPTPREAPPIASAPAPTVAAPGPADPIAMAGATATSRGSPDIRASSPDGWRTEPAVEERTQPPRSRPGLVRQVPPTDRSPIVRSWPAPPKSGDCFPPYRVDADGIKIYKVECL
jgi:serine/threonine-protein kinase